MKMIGRNELCPCGSGIKFKKCCLEFYSKPYDVWLHNAEIILAGQSEKDKIKVAYFSLLKYIIDTPWNKGCTWSGACHATSAIMYVLFNEIGLSPSIYTGVVEYPLIGPFDHSWVEINEEIYDIAVCCPLSDQTLSAPVIRSRNADNLEQIKAFYGIRHFEGLDVEATTILQGSIVEYMDGFATFLSSNYPNYIKAFPERVNGLWDIVKDIGDVIHLKIDISSLRSKYKHTKWIYRDNLGSGETDIELN